MTTVLFIALLFTFVVPLVFIWHDVYDDGIIGRIALGVIALMSFIGMALILDGHKVCDPHDTVIPLALAWLAVAFAVFVTWHLMRFHRRVLKTPHGGSKAFMQRTHG